MKISLQQTFDFGIFYLRIPYFVLFQGFISFLGFFAISLQIEIAEFFILAEI